MGSRSGRKDGGEVAGRGVVRALVAGVMVLALLVAIGWGDEFRNERSEEGGDSDHSLHTEDALPVAVVVGADERRGAKQDDTPRRVTIAGTGDVLIHGRLIRRAQWEAQDSAREYDFRPMFSEVRPIFESVDLAMCHLEVPISRDNTELSGFPLFNAPRELADDLAWAGIDVCSTGSNHVMDQGMEGLIATHDALDAADIAHAGGNRTPEEAVTPRVYEVGDVAVGHISATFSTGHFPRPQPWVVDLLDDDRFEERARAAREAGADLVVASLHWGHEYVVEPTVRQKRLGRRLLEEGVVDVILGHHAHVVQPITFVEGRPLVYGQGNFVSNQTAACCHPGARDGIIPVIEMVEDGDGGWRSEVFVIPIWVDRPEYTVVDVRRALFEPERSHQRAQLEESHRRTADAVGEEVVFMDGSEIHWLEMAADSR